MLRIKTITTAIIVILIATLSFGQSKVEGKPKSFLRPTLNSLADIKSRSDRPWIVFVDRENVETYVSSKKPYKKFKQLEFGDNFYVTDYNKGFIRIGKAKLKSGRKISKGSYVDYGWVPIGEMLLWNSSLVDENTGISKKAFLLNKVEDITEILKLKKKEVVNIYKSPDGRTPVGAKTIYEFYFIAKQEGNRVLLVKDYNLSYKNGSASIVGWVRKNRISEWNTRVCLEPNFSSSGYKERAENPNYEVIAYSKESFALDHSTRGVKHSKKEQVYWSNDPVNIDKSKMAKLNPNRFKGSVMRFPLLKDNKNYFTTGLIGDIKAQTFSNQLENINEVAYSNIISEINSKKNGANRFNILFVLEGAPLMDRYRQGLIDLIENIDSYLPNSSSSRVGVSVYRDSKDYQIGKNRSFEIQPLDSDKSKAVAFLTAVNFERQVSKDKFRSLYYGLNESVNEAGFDLDHTNIICVIGGNADFAADSARRTKAMAEKDKTLIKRNTVVGTLAEVNAHMIGVQVYNEGFSGNYFVKQLSNIIEQNSTLQNNKFKNVQSYFDVSISNPAMPDIDSADKLVLEGGPNYSVLSKANKGQFLSDAQIKSALTSGIQNVDEFNSEFWSEVDQVINDGGSFDDISMGGAQNGLGILLEGLMRKDGSFSKGDLRNLIRNKYKLYAEVFVPKKIKDANNDCFSYVLFMPHEELFQYIQQLRYLDDCAAQDPTEQRDCLYNTLTNLASKFSGDNSLNTKKLSFNDLRGMIEGISKETSSNLLNSGQRNYFIKDVRSKKAVNDEQLTMLVDNILSNKERLEEIYNQKSNYEFSFTERDNTYYWIPIDFTF